MRIPSSTLLVLFLLTACDTSVKPKDAGNDEAKAAADQAETDKRIEERRKAREAADAEKKKAEEDRNNKIKELCAVPEDAKPPKKLDDACNAMAEAQIEFLRRQYAGDPGKLAGVEKNAAMQKANALKVCSSMEIALGLKNAFDNAPEGYGEYMNDIMSTCMQQLAGGPPPPGAGAVPKKRPG